MINTLYKSVVSHQTESDRGEAARWQPTRNTCDMVLSMQLEQG